MSRESGKQQRATLRALAACASLTAYAAVAADRTAPLECRAERPAANGGTCLSTPAATRDALPPTHTVWSLGWTVAADPRGGGLPAGQDTMIVRVAAGGVRDGVYLRTQFFGSQLYTSTYQILGNRIAENPRKVLRPSEFNDTLASKVGTWRIEGDRMVVRWQGEPREFSNPLSKGGNCPNFMGGITCPVASFRSRERITGTFTGTASAGSRGNVYSSTRLQLNADGTYVLTTTGSVVTPDTSAGSKGVEQGRYELSANSSMRLSPSSGTPREVLVFPFPAKDPGYLWFNGQMLQGKVIRQ